MSDRDSQGRKYSPTPRQPRSGTIKHSVMELMLQNVPIEQICERLRYTASEGTVRSAAQKLKEEGLVVPAPRMQAADDTFSFHVAGTGLLMFAEHAAKRGITATEVARRLLRTIAEDPTLVDNVLDDAEDA